VIDAEPLVESRKPSVVKEEKAEYEVPAQEEKTVDKSDYGLCKYQGCGTMVIRDVSCWMCEIDWKEKYG
jgi:hypothetical protein